MSEDRTPPTPDRPGGGPSPAPSGQSAPDDGHTRRDASGWSTADPSGGTPPLPSPNEATAEREPLPFTPTPGAGSTGGGTADSGSNLPQSLQSRYRLLRVLGKGGFANVYLAHDSVLDQKVAIKILKLGLASRAEQDRFLQEARIGAKLRHPNIITVLDIIQSAEGLQMIMEYCPGGTLSDWVKKRGPLKPRQAIDTIRQVAQALGYAHRRNYVHRDIKPANIFVAGEGGVKLGDFGIAAYTDLHEYTQTGMIIGTPLYMAPEQATDSRDVDPRADIYSLGLTLYYLLTGVSPRVLDLDRIPPIFRNLIRTATLPDRNERLVSADQFIAMLDQIQEGLAGAAADSRTLTVAAGAPSDEPTPTTAAPQTTAGAETLSGATQPTATTVAQPGFLGGVPPWLVGMGGVLLGIGLVVVLVALLKVQPQSGGGGQTAGSPPVTSGTLAGRFGGRFGPRPDRNGGPGGLRGGFGGGPQAPFVPGRLAQRRGGMAPSDHDGDEAPGTATTGDGATTGAPAGSTETPRAPQPPRSVAAELDRLRQAPAEPGNHLARAVKLLDDAAREKTPASASLLRQYAIEALDTGLNRNPEMRGDPLAFLLLGLTTLRTTPRTLQAERWIISAYSLNRQTDAPYDLRPETLARDLQLTSDEERLFRRASNEQFLRGPRGQGQPDGAAPFGPRGPRAQ